MLIELNERNTARVKMRAMNRDARQTVPTLATREAVAEVIARFCYENRVSPRMVEIAVEWPRIPHDASKSFETVRDLARSYRQRRI